MSKIVLIFTGGTIAMKIDKNVNAATPSLSPGEIVSTLSGFDKFDNLEIIEFSKLPSPSIKPENMLEIARLVDGHLRRTDVLGCVVIHGTDVLEETAYFLDVFLDSEKPVVMTGSMKNASELGYDGLTNLVSSIKVISSEKSKNKGVLIVMNDQVNSACEATKTHTMNLDTFKSIEFGPIGVIDHGEVIFYRNMNYERKHIKTEKIIKDVALIKVASGMDSSYLDFLVEQNAQGIILESLGRGNVPPEMIPGIEKALDKDIPIIIVSRCPSGRVLDTYGYVGGGKHLTNLGCILGGNLNGQKARILLMLALGHTKDLAKIKELFT